MNAEKPFVTQVTGNKMETKNASQQRTFVFNALCALIGTNDELTTYDMCKDLFSGKIYMPANIVLDVLIVLTNLGMISPIQMSSKSGKKIRLSRSSLIKKMADFENLISEHQDKLKPKMGLGVEFQVLHFLSGCGFLAAAIQLGKLREKMSVEMSQNAKHPKTFGKKSSIKQEELIESS